MIAVGVFGEQVLAGGLMRTEVFRREYRQILILPFFSVADKSISLHDGTDALGIGGGVQCTVF